MDILEAIILGIIQGLTEFLPVSSSGHLELAKAIFGNNSVGKESMLMTVVLHFATALSTVFIFRKEIIQIFKGLFQFKNNDELKFSIRIVLSMIPAAIVGIALKDEIESLFGGAVMLVGCMLLLTGGLLLLADKAKKTDKEVGIGHSILIGISQAIAILPGISRSGATISTSVLLGIDREKSAKFSFLMVVPLIMGAMLVDTKDYLETNALEGMNVHLRAETMTKELVEDEAINTEEATVVQYAILQMEETRDFTKTTNEYTATEIESNYLKDLEGQGLSPETIESISRHQFGMVRSIHGPNTASLGIGFICAFLTGLFACTWMISLVKRAKLKYFSFYCFIVGVGAIIFAFI